MGGGHADGLIVQLFGGEVCGEGESGESGPAVGLDGRCWGQLRGGGGERGGGGFGGFERLGQLKI